MMKKPNGEQAMPPAAKRYRPNQLAGQVLALALLLLMAVAAQPAAASCGGTTTVGDETALNTAIAAFNGASGSCVFTIELSANIPLTASTTRIDNATGGVELVIEGGGYALDGQNTSGVLPLYVQPDTTVTLNNITITRGKPGYNGGGVFNRGDLTINNSTISDNVCVSDGGGIANGGTLVVNDSTITGNRAEGAIAFGGGIYNGSITDNSSAYHGNGTITINRSTITNNSAGSQGSAIAVDSDMTSLTINNSTISGNTVEADIGRAAILNWGSTLIINSSTIADNAGGSVSGIFTFNDTFTTPDSPGVTTVQNSIILQDGTTPACGTVLGGSIVSAGHNLVGDSSCGFTAPGDQQNTDPLLGPLADNGGATFTHALLDNSPAIDAGDTSLTTDQRGVARPQGAADDIGAYEDAGLPPVANNDVYAMPQDTVLTVAAPGILSNDSDPEGHALTVTVTGPPSHGHLAPHPDGSFSYTPDAGYSGTDTFTYKANDGHHDSNEATVTIDVHASNRAPVAHDDAYSVGQGGLLKIDAKKGLLSNDTDADGNQLTVLVQSQPANGVLDQQADGSFTYQPATGFNGTDSYTYLASDGHENSNLAKVTITVNAVNRAPLAADDSYAVANGVLLKVDAQHGLLHNDADPEGDSLSAIIVDQPTKGDLHAQADGSFTYLWKGGNNGQERFTYKATDGQLESNVATVIIDVHSTNQAPVAEDDSYSVDQNTALVINPRGLLANDTDADGNTLQVVADTGPANGTLHLSTDGGFTYRPNPDYTGQDSFTYRASDGLEKSDAATATIDVNASYKLRVDLTGQGRVSGGLTTRTVSSSIDCPVNCEASFPDGSTAGLFAYLDNDVTQGSWSWAGVCPDDQAQCDYTMDADKVASVVFSCELIEVPKASIVSLEADWVCYNLESIEYDPVSSNGGYEILGPEGEVTFRAQNSIMLRPGFKVYAEGVFHAIIE